MKLKFPHPFIILLGFIVFAGVLTYVLPSGHYERILDDVTGREVVVPGTFETSEKDLLTPWEILVSIPKGFEVGADLIMLILVMGGAFYIIDKSGAFNAGINLLFRRLSGSRVYITAVVCLIFSLGGLLENMQEEIIAMIPFMLVLVRGLGYRRFTAVAMSMGSAIIGAALSPINPFQIVIIQKIAGIELFSGSWFRILIYLTAMLFWIGWIIKYGPEKGKESQDSIEKIPLSSSQRIILLLIPLAFAVMVTGVVKYDWDYAQMCLPFLLLGFAAGLLSGMKLNGTAENYIEGFKEMMLACIVVAMARSVHYLMEQGEIVDTIVYYLFSPLKELPLALSATGMVISNALLHIPVSSASGQATLTTPILAPLSDLLGMSQQVMALCIQSGSGLADMFVPTNGALLAGLAASGVNYNQWLKLAGKPLLMVYFIALIFIFIGIYTGY